MQKAIALASGYQRRGFLTCLVSHGNPLKIIGLLFQLGHVAELGCVLLEPLDISVPKQDKPRPNHVPQSRRRIADRFFGLASLVTCPFGYVEKSIRLLGKTCTSRPDRLFNIDASDNRFS